MYDQNLQYFVLHMLQKMHFYDRLRQSYKYVFLSLFNMWACAWDNQQFGFRPGPTQTGLYKYRKELEAWNFGFT